MSKAETERQPRILVVEDRQEVLDLLQRALGENGYEVITAGDGERALQLATDQHPDLVVLDVGLPGRNGMEVARELRRRAFTKPVLMLTARDTIPDMVEGLDAGADDYLAKPFSYEELLARVRALLRRSTLRSDETIIKVGDLRVDTFSRTVTRGERTITMTQKEYALLEYLLRHAGQAVTREQIASHVWRQEFDATTNIVDVYINYIRKKVDLEGEPSMVRTVRGVGYMIKADQG
jgi:DNA-binding response OmpR family regulator